MQALWDALAEAATPAVALADVVGATVKAATAPKATTSFILLITADFLPEWDRWRCLDLERCRPVQTGDVAGHQADGSQLGWLMICPEPRFVTSDNVDRRLVFRCGAQD
ncbi:hypothetical protein HII36_11575 [Nonomuraea sp. NN258]|uniref:hypothetical protein n=1 Tax=Nonomuraea antri TaxID=2730852 RepID=UPI0015697C66|nr:hypothetical protein [Nonomuraea antri]NRQ32474.1 hypothetical protein [Nonomuraea antri]